MTPSADVLDLVRRWAAAEEHNDAAGLDKVLADDFVGVGPLGFVLTRAQWLVRFENGLVNHGFTVEEPQVHDHGAAAVVVGALHQRTTYGGHDNSGRFRLTASAVRVNDELRLSSVHIGPLTSPGPR
jgi:ketosteroid isomerase-like protein